MEFVKDSVKDKIINWDQWVDKYIYKHSELYKTFKKLSTNIPYHNIEGSELNVISPYHSWIQMLRSDEIIIKNTINTSCCIRRNSKTRKNVILNDIVIAIIDKFGGKYQYVSIPYKCYDSIISGYVGKFV